MNEAIAAIDGDGLENNDGNHQRAGRTKRMIVNQTGREWCFYLARVSLLDNPVQLVFFFTWSLLVYFWFLAVVVVQLELRSFFIIPFVLLGYLVNIQ